MYRFTAETFSRLLPGKEWLPVRQGESGDAVFRRSDGEVYAKLSTGTAIPLLDEERRRTEWLSSTGISCPQVLDWTIADDTAYLLTCALPGIPANELSASQLMIAWPTIVQQIKALHELPVDDCPFERRLETMIRRAEDVVSRNAVNPDFLDPDDRNILPALLLSRLHEDLPLRLAQEPGDLVVCHGDACLPNFLVDPDLLHCTGLIDLGRLGAADRYVDYSLLLANARDNWDSAEQAMAADSELFAIQEISSPDRQRLQFYLRLDPLTWG